jgi:hypothetical protein
MPEPVLHDVQHARIVADIDHICEVAGVQKKFLFLSMVDFCTKKEVDWVRKFNQYQQEGVAGLVLEGVAKPDTKCQAIAAAFIRNFMDARVIPLNTLLDMQEQKSVPHPTVLIIPNLFVVAAINNLSAWKIQAIYDLLLDRSIKGKASVVYVEDLKSLANHYGKPFADFLKESFLKV